MEALGGGVGVALFFMLSGAVLMMTNKDKSILYFYKKRLIKIEIPQIIGFLIAFLAMYIVNKTIITSTNIAGFLISAFGLNSSCIPWRNFGVHTIWAIGEWFTTVIIILYIIFPLLRKLIKQHVLITTICITCIFALNLKLKILTAGNGWFSISNGLMCFWLGMLFNEYRTLIYKYKSLTIGATFLLLVATWTTKPIQIVDSNYLPTFIFSLLLFILLYQCKISNRFTCYICKYNYELYLVHHRIYILFLPALLSPNSDNLQIILAFMLLTGFVLLSSEFLQRISSYIVKRLTLQ